MREKMPEKTAEKIPEKAPGKRQHWRAGNMLYPLPAVMISCARAGEKPNIITAAWVGTICSDPAMVSVSIRPERYSYDIIRETGEFVINLTTEELAYATDYCGVRSRPGRGQVPGNGAYARQSAAFKPGSGYPGKPGEYRVPGDRGEGAGEPPHVPGQGAGRERGRGLSE